MTDQHILMDTSDAECTDQKDDGYLTGQIEIPLHEVTSHGVILPIPMICVNCDCTQEDQIIRNYRVIPYTRLECIMRKAKDVETSGYMSQLEISEAFVKEMTVLNDQEKDVEHMLKCISMFGDVARSIDVDDTFIDTSSEGITFDPIRVYENDQTGLLISHKPVSFKGVHFYSQMGDDEVLKRRVRKEMNETDLNQMYYILECFEKSLTFHKTRLCSHSIKIANLCLFYLTLIDNSKPIENMCDTDLKNNIIGYLIDVVVRSRIITKWRLYPCSKNLMKDMIKNYSDQNHMVMMCKLETPRERAEYILKALSKSPETRKAVASLSYTEYEKVLEQTAHSISGGRYYVFRSGFIHGIVATQGFASLKTFQANGGEENE